MSDNRTIFTITGDWGLLAHPLNKPFECREPQTYEDEDEEPDSAHMPTNACHRDTPPPTPPSAPYLRITTDHRPKDWRVGFLIGRSDECDIVLDDERISKKHLAVLMKLEHGSIVLRNYSLNGVYIPLDGEGKGRHLRKTQAFRPHEKIEVEFSDNLKIQIKVWGEPDDWQRFCDDRLREHNSLGLPLGHRDTPASSTTASKAVPEYYPLFQLGTGAFAKVYKVVERRTGNTFAMKSYMNQKDARAQEPLMLERLDHAHVVKYITHDQDSGQLIMEYVRGTSLYEAMDGQKNPGPLLSMSEARDILRQLLLAVEYLHRNRVIHRDIKPANVILVQRQPIHIKLVDFGFATDAQYFLTRCGTPLYVAPEIVNNASNTPVRTNKVDIFSLGVVALQLFGIQFPRMANPKPEDSLHAVQEKRRELESCKLPSDLHLDLACKMLQEDPWNRPSASACLVHPFFLPAATRPPGAPYTRQPRSLPAPMHVWESRPSHTQVETDPESVVHHTPYYGDEANSGDEGPATRGQRATPAHLMDTDPGRSLNKVGDWASGDGGQGGPAAGTQRDDESQNDDNDVSLSEDVLVFQTTTAADPPATPATTATTASNGRVLRRLRIPGRGIPIDEIYAKAGSDKTTQDRYLRRLQARGVVSEWNGQHHIPHLDAVFLCRALDVNLLAVLETVVISPAVSRCNYLLFPHALQAQYSVVWWKDKAIVFMPRKRIVNLSHLNRVYDLGNWFSNQVAHLRKTLCGGSSFVRGRYISLDDARRILSTAGVDMGPMNDMAEVCSCSLG